MKLLITILQDNIQYDVLQELSKKKFRTTRLSSTGGFWKKGNTTILIGVEDHQVDEVLALIRSVAQKEEQKADVANANIFIIDMKDFKKF